MGGNPIIPKFGGKMAQRKFNFNKPSKLSFSPKKEKPIKPQKIKAPKPPKPPKAPKAPKIRKNEPSVKVSKVKNPSERSFSLSTIFPFLNKNKEAKFGASGEKMSKKKKLTIIIIAASALLLAALITTGIILYVNYSNEIDEEGKNIETVYISEYPTVREYYVGDPTPDYSGLKLGITLKNGTSHFVEYNQEENASEFSFSGFYTSVPNDEQKIILNYKGHDCEFYVSVLPRPEPIPVMSGISMETLPKTQYVLGEALNVSGGVILIEYINHAPLRVNLTPSNVFGFEKAMAEGAGNHELEVLYEDESGMFKTTTYTITILAAEATE